MESKPSLLATLPSTLLAFLALYFTTLFSLDTWAAARASPHRATSTNAFYRPAAVAPAADSYQGGMHGRGNAGPRRGGGGGGQGRLGALDTRAPIGMGKTAACGACMT